MFVILSGKQKVKKTRLVVPQPPAEVSNRDDPNMTATQ